MPLKAGRQTEISGGERLKKTKQNYKHLAQDLKQTSLSPTKSYVPTTSRDTDILQHAVQYNHVPCAFFKTGIHVFTHLIPFFKLSKNLKLKLKKK